METTVINLTLQEGVMSFTPEEDVIMKKKALIQKMRYDTDLFVNGQIISNYPYYSDYRDVEGTANSTVAPAALVTQAQAIMTWVYEVFNLLENKILDINSMTDEQLVAFNLMELLLSFPPIP